MGKSAVDFETDLLTLLLADAGIAALTSGRVYALRLPNGGQLPAITFQRIAGRPANTLQGASGLEQINLQLDCWGNTYAMAKELARAARICLAASQQVWDARLESDADFYQEESNFYRISMELTVWYLED